MTRLWQPALAISVYHNEGQPVQFVWQGRRFVVDEIALRWRKRVWWRGIWRDYFKIAGHSGQLRVLVVIYQDLHDNVWYLQEIFD